MLLADIVGTVKEYGLAGGILVLGAVLTRWVDSRMTRLEGRVNDVESVADRTDGTVTEIRDNVRWMRDHMENGKS